MWNLNKWFSNTARYMFAIEYLFFCHTLEMTKPDNCTELWKITMLLCRLYPTYTTNSIKLPKSVPP